MVQGKVVCPRHHASFTLPALPVLPWNERTVPQEENAEQSCRTLRLVLLIFKMKGSA